MPGRKITRTLWTIVTILAVIGCAAALRRIGVLWPTVTRGYVPTSTKIPQVFDVGFAHYPWLTLSHVIPGLLFMILGPLQFISTLRARYPQWHRWSGRVFVACSLIIGVSALALSARLSIGGLLERSATTLFALYFLFALSRAFWLILHRNVALHREWMIRAFAIGLAVATIRPINGMFFGLYFARGFLSPQQFFGIAFWTGFLLHAIAAEVWIRTTRPQLAHA